MPGRPANPAEFVGVVTQSDDKTNAFGGSCARFVSRCAWIDDLEAAGIGKMKQRPRQSNVDAVFADDDRIEAGGGHVCPADTKTSRRPLFPGELKYPIVAAVRVADRP